MVAETWNHDTERKELDAKENGRKTYILVDPKSQKFDLESFLLSRLAQSCGEVILWPPGPKPLSLTLCLSPLQNSENDVEASSG